MKTKIKGKKRRADEKIMNTLKEHTEDLKKFNVKKIDLFGSFVRGEQKGRSDLDFIVEFEKPSFDGFMELVFFLEDLFGRKVDILTPEGVRSIRVKKVAEDIKRSVIYV